MNSEIAGLVVRQNLDSEDFEFNEASRKVRLKSKEIQSYICTKTARANVNAVDSEQRRKLQVKNGFGILHLDFTPTSSSGHLFTLPDDAPTPTSLIEIQAYTGGLIYITAGSRQVHSLSMQVGKRVVVDLVGFFK